MSREPIDAKKYKAALALPSEAEGFSALTVGKFDKSRWPVLTFPTFDIRHVIAAVSPDCSYRFLKTTIDAAKKTLLIYIYDISAPYLLEILQSAKDRGVKIKAMYDGTSGGAAELAALKKVCGASQVKAAPSSGDRNVFTVCHQKFLVIDDATVVVESANWAKSSVPQAKTIGEFKKANREWFVRVNDSELAKWFANLFNTDFKIKKDSQASLGDDFVGPVLSTDLSIMAAVTKPKKVFDVGELDDSTAKVMPVLSPDNYLPLIKDLLKSASKSIYLQQQYILAGNGVKDLLAEMSKKRIANPSFDIRIISSATFAQNWEKTKATLDAAGLLDALKAINPASFGHCHNKGVIVDGDRVVVSSTNWSENSILRAREAGVLIHSEKIAKYFKEVFQVDWEEGLTTDQVHSQLTVIDGADLM